MTRHHLAASRSTPAARTATALAALSTVLGALSLTACGGDNAAPDAGNNPAISPSAITAANSYLHMTRNRVDANGSFVAQDIVLIDAGTSKAVWQQTVDITSTQVAARAFAVSADGLTHTDGADTALYYSQAGKLYELSLLRGSTPAPRQVSAVADVCNVVRAVATTAAANISWVLVNTAGADANCDTGDDNVLKLTRSDAAATVAPKSWAGGNLDALDLHRDANGTLTQLIALEATAGQLLAVSAQDGSTKVIANLGTDTSVVYLGRAAGRRDQVYLSFTTVAEVKEKDPVTQEEVVNQREAVSMRTLNWATDSAVPTLGNVSDGSSGMALAAATLPFAHTDDATAFYFVNGTTAYAIDKGSSTARTLGSLGADVQGVLPGGALSTSALVLPVLTVSKVQTADGEDPVVGVQMVALPKAGGGVRSFDLPAVTSALSVEARQGDVVVIGQSLEIGGPVKALWRASVAPGTGKVVTTVVSARANLLGATRDPAISLSGESANPTLVWCEAATDCKAQGLRSLQLSTGNNLNLAPASLADATVWTSNTVGDTVGTLLPVTVGTQQLSGLWASDSLWLLDATQAGSLRQVTLLP